MKCRIAKHRAAPVVRLLRAGPTVVWLWLGVGMALAQQFRVVHHFNGNDGSQPNGGLIQAPDGVLYGTTYQGGVADNGTLFKVNPDGTGFALLHDFSGNEGRHPERGLVLVGAILYGETFQGGVSDLGTVFSINTDGTGFRVLRSLEIEARYPVGGLVLGGSTFYGISYSGGASGNGAVFRINLDGSGYALVKSFSGADGASPGPPLVLAGSTLYGTTDQGGMTGNGTVYRLNTDGTGFTLLKSFQTSEGNYPCGLVLSDSTLYGAAVHGGIADSGTLFKLNTDGSGFAVVLHFTNPPAAEAGPGPLILVGETLFGTTVPYNGGVFQVGTDGTGLTMLKRFGLPVTDGERPTGPLLLAGTTLYGATGYGGSNAACGALFALTPPPPSLLRGPLTQTAEMGATVEFRVEAAGAAPLFYCWSCDGTNIGTAAVPILQLPGVQPSQQGGYAVVVTNFFGAVTSPPAMLSVISPVERRTVPALRLGGQTPGLITVEYASALNPSAQWSVFPAVYLTNSPQFFFDVSDLLPPRRFYRAWQTNAPSPPLIRDLAFVPALTLTGTVGSALRLDCINQFGPIDAWVTLDTINLTNISQLYFDISAMGQPPRLWRVVPVP